MQIKKHISILILFGILSLNVLADTPMRLPKAHMRIADAQIDKNLAFTSSFQRASLTQARANSPFANQITFDNPLSCSEHPLETKMVDYAARFLGTRYRLGATGPKAFDCSGFTSYVYRNFGISINRTSRAQFLQGDKIAVSNLRPGDLLFFSNRSSGRGNVGHVAMVVSVDTEAQSCTFIHASTKKGVTYQKFPDNGYYQRHFLGARRILGTELDTSADMAQNF